MFQQVLSEGERITLDELGQRIEVVERVRFRDATLRRMIRDFGAQEGLPPLVEVSEGIYELNTRYYRRFRKK